MWENEVLGGPDYWMNRIQYHKQLPTLGPHWLEEQKNNNISEKQRKQRPSA